jgi:hypothetical protein
MRNKIVKETKPTLATYGKYKAKTVHNGEVDSPEQFKPSRHIRGVRLHFLPESEKGKESPH